MKLSILIPARNEGKSIKSVIYDIYNALKNHGIEHEILVVDDNSTDKTQYILESLSKELPTLRYISNKGPAGYGLAVRFGLGHIKGDAVCIMMGDGSDDAADLIKYYEKLKEGYDCVFGSRFIRGSELTGYPFLKLLFNRLGNYFIKFLLHINHNDITNGFKGYTKEVISGVQPLFSNHFNLTVELPLKAIVRGYNFAAIPIKWTNRVEGLSKFKIKEIGSRYLFIILYIFLEKHLSKGDYIRKKAE